MEIRKYPLLRSCLPAEYTTSNVNIYPHIVILRPTSIWQRLLTCNQRRRSQPRAQWVEGLRRWCLGSAVEKGMGSIVISPQRLMMTMTKVVAMNLPRRGESQPQIGSRRQRRPQRGSAIHLPSGPNYGPMINPRQWGAERGGSCPQQHREFTIDPCWDLVFCRDWWDLLRRDSRLGQRRESRRKHGTI